MIGGNSAGSMYGGGGGGIINQGNLTITSSTISGNSSTTLGGGIHNYGGALTVAQSTISGNSSTRLGGGVYSRYGLTVNHSTISGNFSTAGGGGILGFGVALNHSIVAGNTGGGAPTPTDVLGSATLSFSLLGVDTAVTITGAIGVNLIGTAALPIDPLLGPLADHGGPTMTHALLPGSPAIDTGDPTAVPGAGGVPLHDQRGAPFPRVAGGQIDMGAFEYQTLGDMDFDGDLDYDDIDALAAALHDAAAYEDRYGVPPETNGDTDGDEDFDYDDIPGFVELLGPTPVTSGSGTGASVPQATPVISPPRVVLSRRVDKAEGSVVAGSRSTDRLISSQESDLVWNAGQNWLGRRQVWSGRGDHT
jgi:hypothetical protein